MCKNRQQLTEITTAIEKTMTAAHDSRAEALKEAAVLRSLADQVASPVVAGRKSRKALTAKQKESWAKFTDCVVMMESCFVVTGKENPERLANTWKDLCKFAGIGTGILGWFLWNWAFPLLIELAKLWIESRQQGRVSER